jgi:hypothetical protein
VVPFAAALGWHDPKLVKRPVSGAENPVSSSVFFEGRPSVENFSPEAHIWDMTTSKTIKRPGPSRKTSTYRGVKLQATTGATRFSLAQIKNAVEIAVAKNADALAGGK